VAVARGAGGAGAAHVPARVAVHGRGNGAHPAPDVIDNQQREVRISEDLRPLGVREDGSGPAVSSEGRAVDAAPRNGAEQAAGLDVRGTDGGGVDGDVLMFISDGTAGKYREFAEGYPTGVAVGMVSGLVGCHVIEPPA